MATSDVLNVAKRSQVNCRPAEGPMGNKSRDDGPRMKFKWNSSRSFYGQWPCIYSDSANVECLLYWCVAGGNTTAISVFIRTTLNGVKVCRGPKM